jgi:hypothetical protein
LGHIEPRDATGLTGALDKETGIKPATNNTSAWLETVSEDADPALLSTVFKSTGFGRDTLSGKVIIRGKAEDNQRITAIWLNIKGAPVKILDTIDDWEDAKKVEETVTDQTDITPYLGRLKPADDLTGPVTGAADPKVGVYDVLDLAGHRVEWAYIWDTEGGTPVIGNDVTVQVIGEDKSITKSDEDDDPVAGASGSSVTTENAAGPYAANGTGGGANVDYNTISLSLAPYITTLTRYTESNANTKAPELRSKNGWFSFRRSNGDNEQLQVEGFNLKGTQNSAVTIDGANVTGITSVNTTAQYFNVPAAANSGVLAFSAGNTDPAITVAAVNNRNNNANSWNKEALAGNDSSTLWTDDRYVHLFDSHNIGGSSGTTANEGFFRPGALGGKPVKPSMTYDPSNGRLWAAWSSTMLGTEGDITSRNPIYYSSNYGNADATYFYSEYDPSEDTDVTWNSNAATQPTTVWLANVNRGSWNAGGLFATDATAAYNARDGNTIGDGQTRSAYYVERFDDTTNNQMLLQFVQPHIAVNNNRLYVSYFDAKRNALKYWTRVSGTNTTRQHSISIDGGTTPPNNNDNNTNVTSVNSNRVAEAGEYNAIDYISTGAPVIVYMARVGGTEVVKYAYPDQQNRATPSNTQWATATIPGTTNGGRYLSMRIDNNKTISGTPGRTATNDIHITYMDGDTGDLMYVRGTLNATGGTSSCAYNFTTPIVIDSVGNVGKWTDITLDDNGMPYISYLDQGGIDSKTGLKMAFYDPAISTAAVPNQNPGTDASGWEHVTLPGRYAVNDVRTQIEYDTRTARTWNAALAYVSGNAYRISYYVK